MAPQQVDLLLTPDERRERRPMQRLESCPMDEEHKPVTIADVIAGGQTIATHCLACGHRGDLDPRVLAVAARSESPRPAGGVLAPYVRCDRCGARFPRVGLQMPPRLALYTG
jgi:hypothetical protein